MHKLDHIVFGSSSLEEGTEFVENILQAKLSDIGYHKDMGTHNRVIRISERVYLEVIAIDPKISNFNNRKWFKIHQLEVEERHDERERDGSQHGRSGLEPSGHAQVQAGGSGSQADTGQYECGTERKAYMYVRAR